MCRYERAEDVCTVALDHGSRVAPVARKRCESLHDLRINVHGKCA